ncbi:MlaD family protein [Gordonia sp. (in: high G+C Gram-positive bacteria)]|uniref:MlaD family protein n=1 Tax=Gordonia sp. (in: high G+C Gram-positive bacteria) TaxID=84139 RepID=UPI00352871E8
MTTLSIRTAFKALLFMVVGLLAAVLVVNTLRVPLRGPADTYVLMFTDAEGLLEGNPVKMSGVRVGRVESVSRHAQPGGTALAEVTVRIERAHPVPERVRAAIRYGDMLGARYVALSPGDATTPARTGRMIPAAATAAPIDLTALMNGFEPLFASLPPKQVNELAQGFVDTFAGRTKSVQLLLRQIGSMGANLQANSAVFARLVTNLNTLMSAAEAHSGELNRLLSGLGGLTSAIVGDDGEFTRLISSGDRALSALAQMMTVANGSFAGALSGLNEVTAAWIPQTGKFETFLTRLPMLADKINHSGRYGGFMMLYLCNFTLKAGELEANIFGPLHSSVCR